MDQRIINILLGTVATASLGLGGWALGKIVEQDAARSAQAEATLALKDGAALVLKSLGEQSGRLSVVEREVARLSAEAEAARRDISRIERGDN